MSHGPAQLQDFVWWSGLTTADAKTGIASAGAPLEQYSLDGKHYWFDPSAAADLPQRMTCVSHLLPNFDEYTVAYRDRSALQSDPSLDAKLFSFGNILSNVLVVNGVARGDWRRTATGNKLRVEVRLIDALEPDERDAVAKAAHDLGGFMRKPVDLMFSCRLASSPAAGETYHSASVRRRTVG